MSIAQIPIDIIKCEMSTQAEVLRFVHLGIGRLIPEAKRFSFCFQVLIEGTELEGVN